MNAKNFGLLGKNISYSFSQAFFEAKFQKLQRDDCRYHLFDISEIDGVEEIFKTEGLRGLNVTQPYKVSIIPFLDNLSPEAAKIGAVNTILIKDGRKTGFNTDAFGFAQSLELMHPESGQQALILGNGGAAKAVIYVLNKRDIPYQIVSRKGKTNFDNLSDEMVQNHHIIIQCTPVGTFPNITDHLKFPFHALSAKHKVLDLIYNPENTEFLKNASAFGAVTMNGMHMLKQQAEKSWQIWNS